MVTVATSTWYVALAVVAAAACCGAKAENIAAKGAAENAGAGSPTPAVILMLVRSTLAALNQANFTGNYAVLHGLGTPELQAIRSPADWATAFSSLRERNVDLSPLLLMEPQLTEPARISSDGKLRLAGRFPTKPLGISFAVVFKPVLGVWRIEELSVAAERAQAKANGAGAGAGAGRIKGSFSE